MYTLQYILNEIGRIMYNIHFNKCMQIVYMLYTLVTTLDDSLGH